MNEEEEETTQGGDSMKKKKRLHAVPPSTEPACPAIGHLSLGRRARRVVLLTRDGTTIDTIKMSVRETSNEQHHSINHNLHEYSMYLLLSMVTAPPRTGLAIRPKLSGLLADFWAIVNER